VSRGTNRFFRDERGALYVEYLVVLAFIAFGASSAVLYCAYVVAGNFVAVRNYLLYPFP
jgi:Flp pilus assembly pilin Flp